MLWIFEKDVNLQNEIRGIITIKTHIQWNL